MATRRATQRDQYEIWEPVGPGAVWVTTTDVRGNEKQVRLGKGGVARLRIKAEDVQAIKDAFPDTNPFESGRLRRVDEGAPAVQPAQTNEELIAGLASPSLEEDLMRASEFDVRRLKDLAEVGSSDAVSVGQLHVINKVIEARWPRPAAPSDQVAAATERYLEV